MEGQTVVVTGASAGIGRATARLLPGVLAAGAGVDVLHTASMIMLAAVDRRSRRVALTDALAESLFAAAGISSAGIPG
jgi:NADP-dependent 3-hydroxy acid dehydrogenase YdfG